MKEHEKHIKSTYNHKIPTSLCGEKVFEFAFESIDHVFFAVKNNSPFIPCEKCLNLVLNTFGNIKDE